MDTLKKFSKIALAAVVAVGMASCTEDNGGDGGSKPTSNVIVSGLISSNTTWSSDNIYQLAGRVVVDENVTLTIEPGTIIKGQTETGSLASVLIISRGGKIDAEGTAANPIIFTSLDDNIEKGQRVGTNLSRTQNELWGGLIILGKAPISAENGDTETNIEGLPANEAYGLYGGTDVNDNSGTLKYVSVRHGGTTIGEGNEINGITFGGVGAGTVVDQVEVYATLDDGIECFGGSVNINNALIYFQGDDGVDLDMNYSGAFTNFAVIHGDGIGTDEGLEIDGPENSTYTNGMFSLVNGTVTALGNDGSPADLKSKAQGTITNVKFSYPDGATLKVRASYQNDCADSKTDAFTHLTDATPTLVIAGSEFDGGVSVYTGSTDNNDVDCTVPAVDQTAAEAVVVSTTATGADMSVWSWTCASERGEL
ncbi:MAG: hypothetical protein EP346_04840 [Bacteroidetes bacterium]|nr:MAG: hypothetical protein EP346_04840 [Bacteroidota bacterium]